MFYLLVVAIPPYFLAEVFCELAGPVCWFHVIHPSQDKDIVFWSMAFPSLHTTSALACIQTCSLGSGVDYSSRQAPLSALGKKSTRIEMRGYGNLNSYGNRPAYIF